MHLADMATLVFIDRARTGRAHQENNNQNVSDPPLQRSRDPQPKISNEANANNLEKDSTNPDSEDEEITAFNDGSLYVSDQDEIRSNDDGYSSEDAGNANMVGGESQAIGKDFRILFLQMLSISNASNK